MLLDTDNGGGSRHAMIDVDYDEFHPETFRGIYVTFWEPPYSAIEKHGPYPTLEAAQVAAIALGAGLIGAVSSYDHFIADGGVLS